MYPLLLGCFRTLSLTAIVWCSIHVGFNCCQHVESKNFCTSFSSWDVVLLPLKKLFYFSFVSCFSKSLVFPCVTVLPCLGCGCLMPFMPLCMRGCLRPAILVGFPRPPSQFSLKLCPWITCLDTFGDLLAIYWSCKLAQVGRASPPVLSALLPRLIGPKCMHIQPYPCLQVPVFLLFVSREPTTSLAQWEVVSENVFLHEEPKCLIWE